MLGAICHIWCHLREHAERACTDPASFLKQVASLAPENTLLVWEEEEKKDLEDPRLLVCIYFSPKKYLKSSIATAFKERNQREAKSFPEGIIF